MLATGQTVYVDGVPYRFVLRRLRCGFGGSPPYLGLCGPEPTAALDRTEDDGGSVVWWLSHLRVRIVPDALTLERPVSYDTRRVWRR